MSFPDISNYREWTIEERVQGALAAFWLLISVPAILWWTESIPFLVFCSVYANFAGHLAGWESAHDARKIQKGQNYEGRNDA